MKFLFYGAMTALAGLFVGRLMQDAQEDEMCIINPPPTFTFCGYVAVLS